MNATNSSVPTRRRFIRQGLALATAGFAADAGLNGAEVKAGAPPGRVPPTEDLMREHGVLNRVLLVYDEVLRRLAGNEEVPPEAVRDAAKIVRSYVEDYHERLEQDYLFPRFINANRMTDLVQILLEQHMGGRNLTDVATHLAKTSALKDREDRRKLADALGKFVYMYHAHEAHEDTVLFPTFRTMVSAHEFSALREEFDKRERETFGGDSFGAMVERVSAIERQLGIDNLAKFTRGT